MKAAVSPPAKSLQTQRPYRADQTFLPAALELLETPPSPVQMSLMMLICAFITIAVAWAYIGHIDIIAAAQGKIVPTGRVKVVQPLQTGKVAEILVQNGDRVSAGQVLVQLDATELRSELTDQMQGLAALSAEALRRKAVIVAANAASTADTTLRAPQLQWTAAIPTATGAREQRVLDGDLAQLTAQLQSINSQIAQKSTAAIDLQATIAAEQGLIDTLKDRAAMRQTLVDRQAGSKADWLDSLGALKNEQVTLTSNVSQLDSLSADVDVLHREAQKVREAFIADNTQKLADVERHLDAARQKVAQGQSQLSQMTLRSPIDGIVQASTVTTIGQVVTTGEQLLRVVPIDSTIEIEAYLPNADIGFVKAGQQAHIKVDAFPFTRYGTITGTVMRVGKDAIPAADAQQAQADSSHPGGANPAAAGAQHTANLVFPVTVALDTNEIDTEGVRSSVSPGMGVTVEINTGSRRIFEYVFSPLVEVAGTALHER
jgi:hemolysin D